MTEQLDIYEIGQTYQRTDETSIQRIRLLPDGEWFYMTQMQAFGPQGQPMGMARLKIEAETVEGAFAKLDEQRATVEAQLRDRVTQRQMSKVLNAPVTEEEARRFKLNGR